MKIHQLSLFAENKPGTVIAPCRLLAESGIDIRALSLADTQQFRHPAPDRLRTGEAAASLLEEAGFRGQASPKWWPWRCRTGRADSAECWRSFEGSPINIEYMYAFPFGAAKNAPC